MEHNIASPINKSSSFEERTFVLDNRIKYANNFMKYFTSTSIGDFIIVLHFKNLKIIDITKRKWSPTGYSEKARKISEFMEKYKFSNGKIIIDYLREIVGKNNRK